MTCFARMRQGVLFLICGLAMTAAHVTLTGAQDKSSGAANVMKDAAQNGFPLTSSSTDVTGNISVESVLIPAKIAKTVFGKEISNNYAIIELTISNRSSDDSFIVHSVFVDYSQWLLSGASPFAQQNNPRCLPAPQSTNATSSPGSTQNAPAGQPPSGRGQAQSYAGCGNPLQPWQQQTIPNQIDSVESRVVRGELLDRQPWTTRNWVLRALQATGSIATSFTFATNSQSWIRGIGAFNGAGIPAAQTLWPDATVGQMNRISDLGFQVNKVVAKQSSDIVVAFFPIERFLTPDLKSLFISSPSVFFSPLAASQDPNVQRRMDRYINFVVSEDAIKNMTAHLYQVVSGDCMTLGPNTKLAPGDSLEKLTGACQTAELVNRLSLNVVRVRVSGSMTVDVNQVPPQIKEVDIVDAKTGEESATIWKKGATLTGVIQGSFLGGGTPAITDASLAKILPIKVTADGSNDTQLYFTITESDILPEGTTKLNFQVSKKSASSTITSTIYEYTIPTAPSTGANPGAGAGGATPAANPQPAAPAGSPGAAPAPNPANPPTN